MLHKLSNSGDPALEPLVITDDQVISVGRDHIQTPQALANLFCNQLHRLRTTYIDPNTGNLQNFQNFQIFLGRLEVYFATASFLISEIAFDSLFGRNFTF